MCRWGSFGAYISLGLLSVGNGLMNSKTEELKIIGAGLLMLLALRLYFAGKQDESKGLIITKTYIKDFTTVFGIAISSPIRIVGYLALFTIANSMISLNDFLSLALIFISSTIGTIAWWALYCNLICKLKISATARKISGSRKILAVFLFVFAFSGIPSF